MFKTLLQGTHWQAIKDIWGTALGASFVSSQSLTGATVVCKTVCSPILAVSCEALINFVVNVMGGVLIRSPWNILLCLLSAFWAEQVYIVCPTSTAQASSGEDKTRCSLLVNRLQLRPGGWKVAIIDFKIRGYTWCRKPGVRSVSQVSNSLVGKANWVRLIVWEVSLGRPSFAIFRRSKQAKPNHRCVSLWVYSGHAPSPICLQSLIIWVWYAISRILQASGMLAPRTQRVFRLS